MNDESEDPELQAPARQMINELLRRRCLLERMFSVLGECHRVLVGRQNGIDQQKPLPDYCYCIFEKWRNTYFRVLPTLEETVRCDQDELTKFKTFEEAKAHVFVDWRRVGRVVGVILRSIRFFDRELGAKLEPLVRLTAEEQEEFWELLCSSRWLKAKIRELKTKHPGKRLKMVIGEWVGGWVQSVITTAPTLENLAYQFGVLEMAELSRGTAEGLKGLLDDDGEMVGKSKREFTYFFLLIAWPEINEMQEANPPKTRNDLWEWMKPLCYAGFVEVSDLDQLLDVCDDIQLKLAKPGPPRKLG